MIFHSPHRARYAALPAVVLAAGGAALLLHGWHTASKSFYVWGLILTALSIGLVIFLALPRLRRLIRLGMCVALVAAMVSVGIWLPVRALNAEFAGSNVRWSIPTVAPEGYRNNNEKNKNYERVVAVFGNTVVLTNGTSARLISLTDGREITKIPVSSYTKFLLAGDGLLVIESGFAMLYNNTGKPVWPQKVRANDGIAVGPRSVVLATYDEKTDQSIVSAIADDGSVRWTHETPRTVSRFPNTTEEPDQSFRQAVLPSLAALPVKITAQNYVPARVGGHPIRDWHFVDPVSGKTTHQVRGTNAGVMNGNWVTVTPIDSQNRKCELRAGGLPHPLTLPCAFDPPWAQGNMLFIKKDKEDITAQAEFTAVEFQPNGQVIDKPIDVKNPEFSYDWHREFSYTGMVLTDDNVVRGYPDLRSDNSWRFLAETNDVNIYIGQHTVVAQTNLPRTNPLDSVPGYSQTAEGLRRSDNRITVLDLNNGKVTGSVRVHDFDSTRPIRQGTALVVADGQIMLVGNAISDS